MSSAAPARTETRPGLDVHARLEEVAAKDALGLLAEAIRRGLEPSVYWSDAHETVIGLGVAEELRAEGPGRLDRLDAQLLEAEGEGRWFGSFSFEDEASEGFAPFGSARFFRPQVVWRQAHGASAATLGQGSGGDDFQWRRALAWAEAEVQPPGPNRVAAHAEPEPRSQWAEAMRAGLDAIAQSELDKIVLSRRIEVRAEAPFSVPSVLASLPRRSEAEAAFAFFAGDACFLGLTPERLIRVEGREAWTEALAGTSSAEDPDGAALLDSAKDLEEHRHVLEYIVDRLRPLADAVQAAPHPILRKLGTLAHMCTPISAHGVDEGRLLALAGALHPTPAVGGMPALAAKAAIARAEGRPRGLYAGGIGWVAPKGQGMPRCELRVALRSALLQRERAWVFVGAGIVAGSTEASEWRETALKARRTLEALGA